MTVEDPYRQMERLRAERDRHKENSARTAFAWGFGVTRGVGETRFTKRISFNLAFIQEPAISYGYAVEAVANNSDYGDVLVDNRFPRCVGGVYDWQLDSRGFYLGAWAFAVVQTLDTANFKGAVLPEPGYTIRHSFGFTGLAFKALPDRLGDEL